MPKSDNINIPPSNTSKPNGRSGIWFALNPFASKEVNTPVQEEAAVSSEDEIFSMEDSENIDSSEDDFENQIPEDWQEIDSKRKNCCSVLSKISLLAYPAKNYTPLITQYEVEIDKHWRDAEKLYNKHCTVENLNQTVDYYMKELFHNIGWVFFGMFLAKTQKVNIPVYITDCQ